MEWKVLSVVVADVANDGEDLLVNLRRRAVQEPAEPVGRRSLGVLHVGQLPEPTVGIVIGIPPRLAGRSVGPLRLSLVGCMGTCG